MSPDDQLHLTVFLLGAAIGLIAVAGAKWAREERHHKAIRKALYNSSFELGGLLGEARLNHHRAEAALQELVAAEVGE